MNKLKRFFSKFELIRYKKGDIILAPYEQINNIFFLEKGYVKQYAISEEGEEITIHIFRSPAYFPMMLVMADSLNRYFFEASSAVEIRKAPASKTLEFVKNDPAVLFDLSKRFAGGINGLAIRLENLITDHSYKRVVSFFLYLAKTFGKNKGEGVIIKLPLTHKEIAAWVNLTRETTSRQIEKLLNKKLITQSKHIFEIKDIKKMANQLKDPLN